MKNLITLLIAVALFSVGVIHGRATMKAECDEKLTEIEALSSQVAQQNLLVGFYRGADAGMDVGARATRKAMNGVAVTSKQMMAEINAERYKLRREYGVDKGGNL